MKNTQEFKISIVLGKFLVSVKWFLNKKIAHIHTQPSLIGAGFEWRGRTIEMELTGHPRVQLGSEAERAQEEVPFLDTGRFTVFL